MSTRWALVVVAVLLVIWVVVLVRAWRETARREEGDGTLLP